jgi:adenosine/AMP kinase
MMKSVKVMCSVAAMGLVLSQAAMALPVVPNMGMHAMFGKTAGVKLIKVQVQNTTSQEIQIKAGDQTMTIAAGATVEVKAADGTPITLVNAVTTHQAGETLATVRKQLSNATFIVS